RRRGGRQPPEENRGGTAPPAPGRRRAARDRVDRRRDPLPDAVRASGDEPAARISAAQPVELAAAAEPGGTRPSRPEVSALPAGEWIAAARGPADVRNLAAAGRDAASSLRCVRAR